MNKSRSAGRRTGAPSATAADKELVPLLTLIDTGRYPEAEQLSRKILGRRPVSPATKMLAVSLIGQARFDEALPILRQAARLFPADPEVHSNLGIVFAELDRLDESIECFKCAYHLSPRDTDIERNLGFAYAKGLRWDEALPLLIGAADRCDETGGEIHQQLAICLFNAGRALSARQEWNAAVVPLLKAIELFPGDYVDAVAELASCLINAGRIDEAWTCYRELYQSNPDDMHALCQLISAKLRLCEWTDIDALLSRLKQRIKKFPVDVGSPFCALAFPGFSGSDHLTVAQAHARRMVPDAIAEAPSSFAARNGAEVPGRRLRIGYLSADFRSHAVGFIIPEIIERHDRQRFEVIGYAMGIDDGSAIRRRLASAFDQFVDISKYTIEQTVERLREDEIDILIDLQGWTAGERPAALAQRCAVVQVAWLGYPGTLGHPRLADYLIGDPIVTPADHGPHYTEAIVQMPSCYLPADTTEEFPPQVARSEAGLPLDGFVFCSHNTHYKINPALFDIWCRLLQEVPGSILWLSDAGETVRSNLGLEAARRGVAKQRLVFARRVQGRADHLARLALADLALDTMPYNSHSSGVDTLWAGVPMVTCLGDTFAGRVGASLLRACGMDELVVNSQQAYYDKALSLARDSTARAALRRRLVAARSGSVLFDMRRFVADLEDRYVQMFSDAGAGLRNPILVER